MYYDTDRPSSAVSRHVTVDVYAFSTVWVWVHRVDTV